MPNATARSNATGITLTVLGGALAIWVVARFASFSGLQQTWAPPFARYEWVTLGGAAVAALLLIAGLVRWTRPATKEQTSSNESDQKQ